MSLGNNRDYIRRDRDARRKLAVLKARTLELEAAGVAQASSQAMDEMMAGKLTTQLKAWVDPILAHNRAMRLKNR